MDLLAELNKYRDLKWGDPDKPDDEDASVNLCAMAADRITALEAQLAEARHVLIELRLRLHAAGRRPEECYEMSMIDNALDATRGVK